MQEILEKQIQNGWDFVMNKLYHPDTHMIYDYLTKETAVASAEDYPTPEEIQICAPNPCGWGTGMEDSTLNLSSMTEAVLARYAVTKDEGLKPQLQMLYEGLIKNGTAAEPGFIARSICAADGVSVYMDSSKDQYTNWVYAAHRLLQSELLTAEQKNTLKEILVNIARKLERDLNSEYKGYLCRLDGKPGIVSEMDSEKLETHEILRMPMLYMAAYEASGDLHWYQKYCDRREELLSRAEANYTIEKLISVARGRWGYNYIYYQAQYSMRLLYDTDPDEAYRERYLRLLEISAKGVEEFVKKAFDNKHTLQQKQEYFLPWRKTPANYWGIFYGKSYYVPNIWIDRPIFKWLRNVGESVIIQCTCPDYQIPEWEKEMFFTFIKEADFTHATNYWPVLFCDAWWLAKEKGQLS